MKPVNYKGNQPWIFIGRTDVEAETLVLLLLDAKNWFIGKDTDAGKDWRQKEKGMTEDEMVGWHHWHDEHDFEQAPGDGEGQGGLACCSPWGRKELDMSPLDCKEIQPVHPKGNQSLVFFGRTDIEAETPISGHLMWRADSFEKTLMQGKIEGGRRRGQQRMR